MTGSASRDAMRVAVIGGGCAGLAAAATLASQGIAVTLFESARHLGGRARGLNWKGRRLDNGQHILIGAYSETLQLLAMAGVDVEQALLRLPLQLIQQGSFRLNASSRLPAPLHIMAGVLRAEGLTRRERLSALGFMAALKFSGFRLAEDQVLEHFLKRRQPERIIRLLWEPLCLAALNTPLHMASTQVFLNVLRDSFAGSKTASDLMLPRCDLSTLLATPLARLVEQSGGEIHCATPVIAIREQSDGFAVECAEATHAFSHVVCAVAPFRVQELVQGLPTLAAHVRMLAAYAYQPIYTVYLQYPETVRLPYPMIGLNGGFAQWVLDRGALDAQQGLLAVVVSAEGSHQALPQEKLAEEIGRELAQSFPELPAPLWHKVIAEKRATYACVPDLPRPSQRTPLANFYLAGDYTAGDYPATIEGAVRSGRTCARLLLEKLPVSAKLTT